MSVEIVFETHALTEDTERGTATGWLPGHLSSRGRANAAEMGRRRRHDGITAVFCSDLQRCVETAQIAFAYTDVPILYDWRLRECDFGARNGSAAAQLRADRQAHIDRPYPDGESHRQAVRRIAGLLADLPSRWDGRRVMLIGHVATQRAFEHVINSVTLEELTAANFHWTVEGWEYRLSLGSHPPPVHNVDSARSAMKSRPAVNNSWDGFVNACCLSDVGRLANTRRCPTSSTRHPRGDGRASVARKSARTSTWHERREKPTMGRRATVVLYVLAMVAVVVGVDVLFFRHQFWLRLIVNVGIVLVFAAFYLRFLKHP